MDIQRFDQLARPLAEGRTRRRLLGLVAAIGTALSVHAPEAANNRTKKKKTICHCADATAAGCTTKKLAKPAAKKHLRKHGCDYTGPCRGFNPCSAPSPAGCTSRTHCGGGLACINGACQPCAVNSQCEGRLCKDGACVGETPARFLAIAQSPSCA